MLFRDVAAILIMYDVRQPYETFLIGPRVGGAGGGITGMEAASVIKKTITQKLKKGDR